MSPDEMFEVFGNFDPTAYAAEAAARWPEVHEQSQQRTSGYGKQQWQAAVAEGEAIARKLAELLDSGTMADSREAMDVAEEHRMSVDRWYYPCSTAQHVGLADLFVNDPRFEQYWEVRGDGLAQYVHDAIKANAAQTDGDR